MMNPVTTTYYNSHTLDRVAAIPVVGTFAGVGRVSMGFLKVAFNAGCYALKNVSNQPSSIEEQAVLDGIAMVGRGALEAIPIVGTSVYSCQNKLYKIPGTDDEYEVSFTDIKYKGPIYKGQPCGNGILSDSKGNKYVGMISSISTLAECGFYNHFRDSNPDTKFLPFGPHGQGVFTSISGRKYEGSFHRGRFSGQGKLELSTHSYEGNFSSGQFDGLGTIIYFDDQTKWTGNWSDGARDGEGVLTLADGSTQQGVWSGRSPVGVHTFIDSEGHKTLKKMSMHGVFLPLPAAEVSRDPKGLYPFDSDAETLDQTTPS